MVQSHYYHIFILLAIFQSSLPQRRIKDGYKVESNKGYVVYLLKAPSAPNQYHGWLCGGAIINKDYVITSAACVQDVKHIYVIAGYKKYVSSDKLDEDECVREKKKKVVLTCVPRNYHLDYNKTEVWAKVDIAVVKVESSFDFNDKSYETMCSYMPQAIEFNMEEEFPRYGDHVIVLGWGHSKVFRKDKENIDLNLATLHYAPTRVIEEDVCMKEYEGNKVLSSFIKLSMICTTDKGNLNDKGDIILRSPIPTKGCVTEIARLRGAVGRLCETQAEAMIYDTMNDGMVEMYDDLQGDMVLINDTRRKYSNTSRIKHNNITAQQNTTHEQIQKRVKYSNNTTRQNVTKENIEKRISNDENINKENIGQISQRRDGEEVATDLDDELDPESPGICQNDHGGPLVAWRGSIEILVGVATLYKLDMQQQCMGPNLFTKTSCNSAFLNCVVNQEDKPTRRRCDDPEDVGFEIVRRHISWVGHRDGPAENERIEIRHQVPMSAFHPVYKKSNT